MCVHVCVRVCTCAHFKENLKGFLCLICTQIISAVNKYSFSCEIIDKYGGAGRFQQRVDVAEEVVDSIGVAEGELIQQKYV